MKNTLDFDFTKILFTSEVPVLVNHLNYGNHLGYDSLLSIMQEVRMRWLKANGVGEMSIQDSIGYMVIEVFLSYKSEAFHGDILKVALNVSNLKRKTFDIDYQVMNQRTNLILAEARTSHIFYDFNLKKISSAPENFLRLCDIENSNITA